jgi:hypothetical protein
LRARWHKQSPPARIPPHSGAGYLTDNRRRSNESPTRGSGHFRGVAPSILETSYHIH